MAVAHHLLVVAVVTLAAVGHCQHDVNAREDSGEEDGSEQLYRFTLCITVMLCFI